MPSDYLLQVDPVSATSSDPLQSWTGAITSSLQDLWATFIGFVPELIAALVVFFVGWAIAIAIGRIVERIFVVLRINQAFENIKGLREAAARANVRINIPKLLGEIVKWFLIIVTLLAATDILGLNAVSDFLKSVLAYIPNVVVAALILVVAVVLANFVYRTVSASVNAAGFSSGAIAAAISKWAIIIFAILAALDQLQVASTILPSLTTAIFAMIAIAGGLAFGLGGKDLAAKWLSKVEEDLTDRR